MERLEQKQMTLQSRSDQALHEALASAYGAPRLVQSTPEMLRRSRMSEWKGRWRALKSPRVVDRALRHRRYGDDVACRRRATASPSAGSRIHCSRGERPIPVPGTTGISGE